MSRIVYVQFRLENKGIEWKNFYNVLLSRGSEQANNKLHWYNEKLKEYSDLQIEYTKRIYIFKSLLFLKFHIMFKEKSLAD